MCDIYRDIHHFINVIEKLKKSFSFSRAKLWNSPPTDLRNANTLSEFKSRMCAHKFQFTTYFHHLVESY